MMKEEGAEACHGSTTNPLINPLVAANILSFLDQKNDLLNARRICKLWYDLGTDEILKRKTITTSITCDKKTINRFLKLMTPSQRLPIVRWTLVIDFVDLRTPGFLRLLKFISPSAIKISIEFKNLKINFNQNSEIETLLSRLTKVTRGRPFLTLPRLEELETSVDVSYVGPESRWDHMTRLVERLVVAAGQNLVSFGSTNFTSGLGMGSIVNVLPKGLRKLRLSDFDRSPLYDVDVPYDKLIQSELQLEEFIFIDHPTRLRTEALVEFLTFQKDSLLRLEISKLEETYRQYFQVFPRLEKVTKLRTTVTCDKPTFEFVQQFPNLAELELGMKLTFSSGGLVSKENEDLQRLPQHLSVRKLFISSSDPLPTQRMMISFQLLSHCFPRVTHLSVHPLTSETVGELTQLFTHFPAIEWLHIGMKEDNGTVAGGSNDGLESVLSGTGRGIGLIHLIRLRTLEIKASPQQYSQIFTDLTFRRVFMRMETLKEICFIEEDDIPESCQPFVGTLREKGVDFYCMKRRLGCHFP